MDSSDFEIATDCWFLTGPTASGKTGIALKLAPPLNAEIISLDSMSIFSEMDIGTAKPTREQRAQHPHHLIDIVAPTEDYSLADYVEAATARVAEIRSRGKEVLFVGGTPLYLKSLLRGLSSGPPPDWEFRRQVEEEVVQVGSDALHQRLAQVDPLSAARLHPSDQRRIIRALEVFKMTGEPISHQQTHFDEGRSAEDCRVFVLDWPRPVLRQRINDRVEEMFAGGLIEEVKGLLKRHGELSRTANQALGYREVIEALRDSADLDDIAKEDAMVKVITRTRQFAKRQMTWFRGLSECRMIPRSDQQADDEVVELILASFSE